MKRPLGSGYTMVEVMMVLAVSGLLLVGAITTFGGQTNGVQFNQDMNDVSSKFQNVITQISNDNFPDLSSYDCGISSSSGVSHPYIVPGNGGGNTCVILGRAIQVMPSSSNNTVNIYTVIGFKDKVTGSADSGNLATSLSDSSPAVAAGNTGTPIYFTDSFSLPDNLNIVSSAFDNEPINSGAPTVWDVAGFYSNTSTSSSSLPQQGSHSLITEAYPIASTDQAGVFNGINPSSSLIGYAYAFKQWTLCVQGGSKSRQVIISSTATGVTTTVQDTACAPTGFHSSSSNLAIDNGRQHKLTRQGKYADSV